MHRWRAQLVGTAGRLAVGVVVAAALAVVAYHTIVPWWVLRLYREVLPTHRFVEPPRERGAGTDEVFYLATVYDCRNGDVRIDGVAPNASYWMLGIYDAYARPVPGGHRNHRDIAVAPDGRFRLVVTRHPEGRPDALDCRTAPRGMIIYRVLLPRAPVAVPAIAVR